MLKEGAKPVPRRTMCKITIIFWLALVTDFITSAIFIRSGYGSFEANPYQRAFVENPSLETFLPWLMDLAAWYWFLIGAFGTLLCHFYNVKVENKKMGLLLFILKISLPIAMLIMASYRLLIGTASNTWLIFYKILNIGICPILVQLFLSLAFIILPFKHELTEGMGGWAKHIRKKPLEFPIPLYNPDDPTYRKLVELSKQCHKKVKDILPALVQKYDNIGKIRSQVKKILEKEIRQIDILVRQLLKF